MMSSDEIKREAAQIVKSGIERGCSSDVIAQAVYDHIRLGDPMLTVLSEIAVQLTNLNGTIKSFDYNEGSRIFDVQVRQQ